MVLALVLSPLAHVAMRAADGDLDPTFGTGGLVRLDFGDPDTITQDMAIQADGKILVVGVFEHRPGISDFMLVRLNPDGTLDQSFGEGGLVFTNFQSGRDEARAIAIQPDGKIVVAGPARTFDGVQHFGLARYNVDGSLDTTFDGDGKVITGFAEEQSILDARGLAIQPDGKIVAAGSQLGETTLESDIAIVRYNADGSLDLSFGRDGRVLTDVSPTGHDFVEQVLIDRHGRIIVVGSAVSLGPFALVRYTADGSLDASFGQDGIVTTPFLEDSGIKGAEDAVLLADDRIVLVASANDPFGPRQFVVLARYDDTGALDGTFSGDGLVITDLGEGEAFGFSLAVQRDGKIVAAGEALSSSISGGSFTVLRYQADGSLDATFGNGGTVTTSVAAVGPALVSGVAIQPDGRIVAAGSAFEAGTLDIVLARYDATPLPPPPHTLTSFLHGLDVPGTATGFTMNQTAPAKSLFVNVGKGARWLSDPVVDGTFDQGATFEVVLPCTLGLSFPKSVRLASTDAAGQDARLLGQASTGLRFCQTQTIAIPVTTPAALENRRLKLMISSALPIELLRLGNQTFLRATNFTGVP